jgi:hypothetical protein
MVKAVIVAKHLVSNSFSSVSVLVIRRDSMHEASTSAGVSCLFSKTYFQSESVETTTRMCGPYRTCGIHNYPLNK